MSGECDKCGEHTLDCQCFDWLCSACFVKKHPIGEDFDWRKTGILYMRCEECGDSGVIMNFNE